MPRSWGTNLFFQNGAILVAGSDVACSAGVKTTVLAYGISPLLAAQAGGGFYLLADCQLVFVLGATPPTALVITLDLPTAGANQDTYTVPAALLVAAATLIVSPTMLVPNSGSVWFPTGDNPTFTANPTGQPVTFGHIGSRVTLALYAGA
jgi:hypothetical protein